jgi:hypothetical protein
MYNEGLKNSPVVVGFTSYTRYTFQEQTQLCLASYPLEFNLPLGYLDCDTIRSVSTESS